MITINELKKHYGDFELDLSLEIAPGTVSGLVGRNGAGKSTTIKAILGLIRPDSGTVSVFGKDVSALTPADRENIGAAMSDSGFSTYLTVNDISRILDAMYHDFDRNEFLERCRKGKLPLDKKIKDFSTGMNAKLRVLIAMSHKAKLLILDEPTAGLDVIARKEVLDMLRAYLSEDPERSMIISSHISSDLEGLCDDIYLIHNGKLLLHEDTDRILGEYAVLRVSRDRYETLDKEYILKVKEESFGYSCLTDQKQYYAENCPDIVMESGSVDEMIILMTEDK